MSDVTTSGSKGDVTRLLEAISEGEETAADSLLSLVYHELKAVAAAHLRTEDDGHTLQPTALVHEAYLRLVDQHTPPRRRTHFFAIAAQAMRRVLIDHARRRKALRRGGGQQTTLHDDHLVTDGEPVDMLALHAALEKLAETHERQAKAIELRYFGGLDGRQAAEVLGVSVVTVKRDWQYGRAFLYRELADQRGADAP
ncbi:MAG: ECF-type sigma factor [Gemmatimonadota bacterium]